MAMTATIRPLWKSEAYPNARPRIDGLPASDLDQEFPGAVAVLLQRDGRHVYAYRYWGTGGAARAEACKRQWESGASWTNQEMYL